MLHYSSHVRVQARKLIEKQQRSAITVAGQYSNDNNPFNDDNLHKRFVWTKKVEKQVWVQAGAWGAMHTLSQGRRERDASDTQSCMHACACMRCLECIL
jgi:hypothetical protein